MVSFTEEVRSGLAKPRLIFRGGLDKRELTSLVKFTVVTPTVRRRLNFYLCWFVCLWTDFHEIFQDRSDMALDCFTPSYPSHKSHNALDKYPTMHNFVTEMYTHVHISVTKWCIAGHGMGACRDFARYRGSDIVSFLAIQLHPVLLQTPPRSLPPQWPPPRVLPKCNLNSWYPRRRSRRYTSPSSDEPH